MFIDTYAFQIQEGLLLPPVLLLLGWFLRLHAPKGCGCLEGVHDRVSWTPWPWHIGVKTFQSHVGSIREALKPNCVQAFSVWWGSSSAELCSLPPFGDIMPTCYHSKSGPMHWCKSHTFHNHFSSWVPICWKRNVNRDPSDSHCRALADPSSGQYYLVDYCERTISQPHPTEPCKWYVRIWELVTEFGEHFRMVNSAIVHPYHWT